MALTHDIAARALQATAGRVVRPAPGLRFAGADLPAPEPLVADTEAGPVRVLVYRPADAGPDAPVYVNFHGGGFVVRQPDQDDHLCRHLAAELGAVVLNVDYDTAPQHRFPVAPTQAQAVLWWARLKGRTFGWDGRRIALGGQSAGGNLALGACLELPARMAFKPLGVVAVYPVVDLATPAAAKVGSAADPVINPRIAAVFDNAYLPDRAARVAPLASPVYAPDLAGFPPLLMVVAEHDILRAEGERFAAMADAAGATVRLRCEPGVDHGYVQAGPRGSVAATLAAMVDFLRPLYAASGQRA